MTIEEDYTTGGVMDNRRFAELCGIEYHYTVGTVDDEIGRLHQCKCGKVFFDDPCNYDLAEHMKKENPDYAADPRLVLWEIERMNRLSEFLLWLSKGESVNRIHVHFMTDTTGLLRDRAVEWLETKSDRC